VEQDEITALFPLALGHDQDASACPWVQITRQTSDYPSRKAQLAIDVIFGRVPPPPDIVDLLYRCDHCSRCRAASTLPDPPDLARALCKVRASLAETGAVPEVSALVDHYCVSGSVFGDLRPTSASLPMDDEADVLFVPGASMLAYAPEIAHGIVDVLRLLDVRVACEPDVLDSGQEFRELGMPGLADDAQDMVRNRVAETSYRLVIAGTPKDAFGLRFALADAQVEVKYAGTYLAERFTRFPRPIQDVTRAIFFHPSEVLLHDLDSFEAIDTLLGAWFGDTYRRESDPRRNAFPAAIERPSPRVSAELSRKLAEQRLGQILSSAQVGDEQLSILTSDPYSLVALRAVASPNVEVHDLVMFASRLLRKEVVVEQ
jgi:Fe-S oxidoreductase